MTYKIITPEMQQEILQAQQAHGKMTLEDFKNLFRKK